jgi:hypothetical protein
VRTLRQNIMDDKQDCDDAYDEWKRCLDRGMEVIRWFYAHQAMEYVFFGNLPSVNTFFNFHLSRH